MLVPLFFSLCTFPALAVQNETDTAYTYPDAQVIQLDLFIHPYHYLQMIHSEEKEKHNAIVYIDSDPMRKIAVQARGDSSFREGMETPVKRIPLELCFDYVDPHGAFRGNPSLKLINCQTPIRLLLQYIAMHAFAFLDVPVPRVDPAFIRINDTDYGLYLAVEDLNESFIKERFGKATLYRPTTKDDMPQRTVSFENIEMLVEADYGDNTLTRYNEAVKRGKDAEKYLNVDEILRFCACQAFLTNDDGFPFSSHNFYLVDDHGKLTLLPWDLDSVFMECYKGSILRDLEHSGRDIFQTLMQKEEYRARFRHYLKQLNEEFLNPDTALPWLEQLVRRLSPYFRRDVTIAKQSDDVFADLTTGNTIYDGQNGNLLLTIAEYHELVSRAYSVDSEQSPRPDPSVQGQPDDPKPVPPQPDRTVVLRICTRYWHLRRQAFLQENSGSLLLCGCLFAACLTAAVLCVYVPKGHRRRR